MSPDIMLSFRKANGPTRIKHLNRWKDGRTNGRRDRPKFIGPTSYNWGSKKKGTSAGDLDKKT